VVRGDVLAGIGSGLAPAWIVDAELDVSTEVDKSRVYVHHGTRETVGRAIALGDGFWQLRLDRPLVARAGDRLVVRSIAPPDTLGGGTIIDPRARRHGPRPDVVERLWRRRRNEPEPELKPAFEEAAPRPAPDLGDVEAELAALRAAGRAVRIGRRMHVHAEALESVRARVETIIEEEGEVTLGRLRDELGTSRKYAQALLEGLDAARVTLRLPDERRVLRRRR
jgi:selenocysteine-specific elongation factor